GKILVCQQVSSDFTSMTALFEDVNVMHQFYSTILQPS
ncbi:hypothetical protein L195_g050716, partial [Trifolium pratense]